MMRWSFGFLPEALELDYYHLKSSVFIFLADAPPVRQITAYAVYVMMMTLTLSLTRQVQSLTLHETRARTVSLFLRVENTFLLQKQPKHHVHMHIYIKIQIMRQPPICFPLTLARRIPFRGISKLTSGPSLMTLLE